MQMQSCYIIFCSQCQTAMFKCYENSGRQLYGVQEAATKMEQTKALDSLDVSAELLVSIIREQTPAASLPYPLNQAQHVSSL